MTHIYSFNAAGTAVCMNQLVHDEDDEEEEEEE